MTGRLQRAARKAEQERSAALAQAEAEERRIAQQRNLFTFLSPSSQKEQLLQGMLQRAYDLMWEGLTEHADAILEFVPSHEANSMLDCWEMDVLVHHEPKSHWYHGGER